MPLTPQQRQQVLESASQAKALAEAFTKAFYDSLGKQATNALYLETSQLMCEGNLYIGIEEIMACQREKFNNTMFVVTTCDGQFVSPSEVVIHVVGQLTSAGQDKPLGFTNVFTLGAQGGSWVITNEIFRLSLHNF